MVWEECSEEETVIPALPPAVVPNSVKAKANDTDDSPNQKKSKAKKKPPQQEAKPGFTQKSMMSFFGKK